MQIKSPRETYSAFVVSVRRDTVCMLCVFVCLLLQDDSNGAQVALLAQISLNKLTPLTLSLSLSVLSGFVKV